MKSSKILISFLLVLLVAVSASAVSAADAADDIVAVDDEADVVAANIAVDGNDDVAIRNAIGNASAGDTIDLGTDKVYTINATVDIDKNITIKGDNVTLNGEGQAKSAKDLYNGFINVGKEGSGSTIIGLTLINVDANKEYTHDNTLKGYGIQLANGATGVTIDDCKFHDFANGVYISSAPANIIKNSWFTGVSTLINNLPGGPKDRGSYGISIMRSKGNQIIGNMFVGPMCDGVSIAGGSGDTVVKGNVFNGNAYSIYFGGASTAGSIIEDNIFFNSGSFSASYVVDGKTVWDNFTDLPVISVQKASDNFIIRNNEFNAHTDNVLIGANEANTAHGYPSDIGNILVTGNTVLPADGAVMSTVVLFNIISETGFLTPVGPIDITNNTLNGAKTAAYWSYDWGKDIHGDVNIKAADPAKTYFETSSVTYSDVTVSLKDVNGKALAGETITSGNDNYTTDENGTAVVNATSTTVTVVFAGSNKLASASTTISIPEQPVVPELKTTKLTTPTKTFKVKKTKKVTVTMKSDNSAVKGKIITLKVNGKTYYATTNAKGQATFTVTLNKAKTYKYTAKFAGDATYKSVSKTGTIKVKK